MSRSAFASFASPSSSPTLPLSPSSSPGLPHSAPVTLPLSPTHRQVSGSLPAAVGVSCTASSTPLESSGSFVPDPEVHSPHRSRTVLLLAAKAFPLPARRNAAAPVQDGRSHHTEPMDAPALPHLAAVRIGGNAERCDRASDRCGFSAESVVFVSELVVWLDREGRLSVSVDVRLRITGSSRWRAVFGVSDWFVPANSVKHPMTQMYLSTTPHLGQIVINSKYSLPQGGTQLGGSDTIALRWPASQPSGSRRSASVPIS